jgi:hypothetical protein
VFPTWSVPKYYNQDSWRNDLVEAGSNTSIVTLGLVGGDGNGGLESETVKCGRESRGTRT